MPQVTCKRCNMNFVISEYLPKRSTRTKCAERDCTRVFHFFSSEAAITKIIQTPDDVALTVNYATSHREETGHVDNGGCQE